MLVSNTVTFAAGLALGWLPWQVGAILGGLLALLALVATRMIDWSAEGPGLALATLPGLVLGVAIARAVKASR